MGASRRDGRLLIVGNDRSDCVPELGADLPGRRGHRADSLGALFYFSLGNQAEEDARRGLGHYYAFLGEYAEQIVEGAAKDKATLQSYVSAFEAAGADEVICFPSSSDPAQVELLADAVL